MTEFPSAEHFRLVARRHQGLAEDADEPELAAVYAIRACTDEAKAQQVEIQGDYRISGSLFPPWAKVRAV